MAYIRGLTVVTAMAHSITNMMRTEKNEIYENAVEPELHLRNREVRCTLTTLKVASSPNTCQKHCPVFTKRGQTFQNKSTDFVKMHFPLSYARERMQMHVFVSFWNLKNWKLPVGIIAYLLHAQYLKCSCKFRRCFMIYKWIMKMGYYFRYQRAFNIPDLISIVLI